MHKPKKSLGQNFLKSELALKKIVEAGEVKKNDVVLEIGPGKGALTEKLLEKINPSQTLPKGEGGCVIAVEKDRELFKFLKTKFEKEISSGQLKLINEDILQFEITNYKLRSYKVIANIPYNITGTILKKFLTEKHQPECMVLMVQHEVAKRITTPSPSSTRRGGKESLLSISVKAYGEPKMIMKVGARYFSPAPKVDSAIIKIGNISRKNFALNSPLEEYPLGGGGDSTPSRKRATPQEGNLETKFWEIVKAGFAHKRKKLSSNLKTVLPMSDIGKLGNKRAEDLSLEEWIKLAKRYNPSSSPLSTN